MGKRKLIDSIKKDAAKQIEADIRESVVKEIYGTSKKAIKKLKKQILKELQTEMFAETKPSKNRKKKKSKKNKGLDSTFVETNIEDTNQLRSRVTGELVDIKKEDEVEAVPPYDEGQTFEYQGFKFDVGRMSSIVTGKDRNKSNVNVSSGESKSKEPKMTSGIKLVERLSESKEEAKKKNEKKSKLEKATIDRLNVVNSIKEGEKKEEMYKKATAPKPISSPNPSFVQGFNLAPGATHSYPGLSSMNMVPSTKSIVKTGQEKITPAKKEEIAFFIGKLKEGIDSLGKGQKNINYRKKKDDVYTFSYSKQALGKDDFSFKFNLDLNLYTLGAEINRFEFSIDGFNFDKGFVEILDMIAVLDATGMSLRKYIDEISEINTTADASKEAIKENLKKNNAAIRANTKLNKFIFDQRILKVLQSNDIKTYGQLKKIEELTSLKGVGAKTADKIEEYLN